MSSTTPDHDPDAPRTPETASPETTDPEPGPAPYVAPAAREPLAPPVPPAAPVPQAAADPLGLQSASETGTQPEYAPPAYAPDQSASAYAGAAEPGATGPRGFAIAALVLGIAGLVLVWLPFLAVVALPAAIVGLILGIVAMRKGQPKGFALTGVILSGVAILISVISMVVVMIGLALLGGSGAFAP